jgi:HAD superfamily hydrolase (TIGR01509 family)
MRAVIFDFDGLIIDSETPLFDIWSQIYESRGQRLTLDVWQHALGTQGGFDPYADLATRLSETVDRASLAEYVSHEHWRLCGDQPLLPGVRDRLIEARSLGLAAAVASSSPAAWVQPWIETHGLTSFFRAVCTRDDVARVKPAPDLFLAAAGRLGVDPADCVVFEDSPNGIRAAHAAGMLVVAVPNGLTRGLAMPDPHLTLTSLADLSLSVIAERLAA